MLLSWTNQKSLHYDDIIVVLCGTVDYSGVTMKYWLAKGQRDHTFNDGQHFWCFHLTKRGLISERKKKYKSLVIIPPVLSFLLRNPDIYGVTFNTFNGQFVSYFMASTIKLNCCAPNVCISPTPPTPAPHTISQLQDSQSDTDIDQVGLRL